MLTEPLPTLLDMRKLAARGTVLDGVVTLATLPRLQGLLAAQDGQLEAHCHFSKDEEGRFVLALNFEAKVSVVCQRCMEPVFIDVDANTTLCILWSEDQVVSLPSHLEPLILDEGQSNLWSVVEDELILSLPIVSYHETGDCVELTEQYTTAEIAEELEQKPNPFQALEALKIEK